MVLLKKDRSEGLHDLAAVEGLDSPCRRSRLVFETSLYKLRHSPPLQDVYKKSVRGTPQGVAVNRSAVFCVSS